MLKTKRVYDKKEPDDGLWILVMRKWPRGIPKGKIDEWRKELGPSKELLDDWNKKRIAWPEYERRYYKEMDVQSGLIKNLAERAKNETITLLCKEPTDEHCHRRLLKGLILKMM